MKKELKLVLICFIFLLGFVNIQNVNAAQKTHCPGGSNCPGIGYYKNYRWSNDTLAWAQRIGLNIDIYSGQFKTIAALNSAAYGGGGCVWFATSRIREITGRTDIGTYDWAKYWYNGGGNSSKSWAETYGYPKGTSWPVGLQKAIACYTNHVQIIEAVEGDNVLISENNGYWSGSDSTGVVWKTKSEISNHSGDGFGTFQGFIYLTQSTGSLDVNGILDGVSSQTTGNYGTFDVYIDNVLKADDVNDYSNTKLSAGTKYKITDIKENDGYSYDGNAVIEGTISTGNTSTVKLIYNSCLLEVRGFLDNQFKDTLSYYGTFDVVVDGWTFCHSFDQTLPKGTNYEIKNIKANNGYNFNGVYSGSLTGTIGSGITNITLSFYKIGELSCDWIETDVLPGNVNTNNCEIQYNYHYKTTASVSPGTGWSKVSSETVKYENIGSEYESDIALPISETRELVGYYYYHYCGNPSHPEYAEHYYRPEKGYTKYHETFVVDSYDEAEVHVDDSGNADYLYYLLKWNTGQWNGGVATCSDGSKYWYKMYKYQDKQPVTYYTWVKDSGWTAKGIINSDSVTFRYRLKSGCGARDIVLPAGLKEIQSSAFEGSTAINEVTIPNGVKTIGSRAFANCSGLTLVRIPSTVSSIGTSAFLNDTNVILVCQSNSVCVSYAQQNGHPYRTE